MGDVKKGRVVELATRQSQNAQRVTRALRSHGWTMYFRGGERQVAGDEWRAQEAEEALVYALLVERDAKAIRTWVEAFALAEGANVGRAYRTTTGVPGEFHHRAKGADEAA